MNVNKKKEIFSMFFLEFEKVIFEIVDFGEDELGFGRELPV